MNCVPRTCTSALRPTSPTGPLTTDSYGFNSATVSCGFGEELLSVAVDWIDDNGHGERNFSGVGTINFATDPQTAVVEANFDGGGGAGNPAQFVAVAVCIF